MPIRDLSKLLCSLVLFGFVTANAQGATPYVPLKKDPLLDRELERLASVTGMPALRKPYSVATVSAYLDKLTDDYPALKSRLARYLSRYQHERAITQLSAKLSVSNSDNKNIPNSRGSNSNDNGQLDIDGYYRISDNWLINLSASARDESDSNLSGSSVTFGGQYLQVDLGYKENWLSPFQDSAMLASTNAKAPINISFSAPTPISDWSFDYALTMGLLEKQDGIRLGDTRSSGRPGYLAMYLGFKPFDWWTLGVNRTFMFSGGDRGTVSASDVWQAIIDPVSSDNCGGDSPLQDCTQEFGNQQASLTSKFDFSVMEMPVSFYFEYAGEDTRGFKSYFFSNRAESLGLFLPYLTENSSLTVEYNHIENAWYTHHLYAEGFRNDLVTMGHWWGDEKYPDDSIGAKVLSVDFSYQLSTIEFAQFKYRNIYNDPAIGDPGLRNTYQYSRGQEIQISYDRVLDSGRFGLDFYTGKDVFDNDFYIASVRYHWE